MPDESLIEIDVIHVQKLCLISKKKLMQKVVLEVLSFHISYLYNEILIVGRGGNRKCTIEIAEIPMKTKNFNRESRPN
jgi:hypothetical protein